MQAALDEPADDERLVIGGNPTKDGVHTILNFLQLKRTIDVLDKRDKLSDSCYGCCRQSPHRLVATPTLPSLRDKADAQSRIPDNVPLDAVLQEPLLVDMAGLEMLLKFRILISRAHTRGRMETKQFVSTAICSDGGDGLQ